MRYGTTNVQQLLKPTTVLTRTIATTEANLLDALETQIIFTSKDCKWLYYS